MSNNLTNNKYGKYCTKLLGLFLASLFLSAPVFAETVFTVRNSDELIYVLNNIPGDNKRIVLIDNVIVYHGQNFHIPTGHNITLDLGQFNFQGNQSAHFFGGGVITIRGSTTAFNLGFELHGDIILNYEGIYSMSGVDRFAGTFGDNVTVNLNAPGSTWQGSTLPGPYLSAIAQAETRDGTIIIGHHGNATMNAANTQPGTRPVTVRNAETVLGAYAGSAGTLNLTGRYVDWFTSGSFYVGYGGTGVLSISDGIELKTGSIVVGKESTANGYLSIHGEGTIVNLYGRNEGLSNLLTQGAGRMCLSRGALLRFDDTTTYLRDISGYTPKLGLGSGNSTVIGASILGIRLSNPQTEELIIGQANTERSLATINPGSIFAQAGQILGTMDGALDGPFNGGTLTFGSNSLLEGSLNIAMAEVTFQGNHFATPAVLSPGEGQYNSAEFGRINFITNNLTLGANSRTYIDFSVHGDLNFTDDPNAPIDHRLGPNSAYDHAYLGDFGRDVISVTEGGITAAGSIHFRPQSGYYSDQIDVRFMEFHETIPGSSINFNSAQIDIIPSRWFGTPRIEFDNTGDVFLPGSISGQHLRVDRHTTPFTDAANSFNTRSVGTVLEYIYNKQTNRGWLEVLNWLWLMDDDEFRKAMQQLSGETRASSFLMPVRSPWRLVFDRMTATEVANFQREAQQRDLRQRQQCCGTFRGHSARTSSSVRNGIWASPYYDFLRASNDSNVNAATHSRIGFITGYDRALSNRSSLGVVFSYSNPEMRQLYSRVKADDYMVGVHFNTLLQNRFELKLWGSYGTQAYRMNRYIPLPHEDGRLHSNFSGNTVALSSQVAMPLRWRDFLFRPHAALDFNYVQQNSATERGYEEIRLHYYSSDWAQFLGRIGVRSDHTFRRWDLSNTLGYSFMFAGDTAPIVRNQFMTDGPAFNIKGSDLGRHFISHGIGARRWLNDQNTRMFFIQYSGEYGRNSNAQTAMIGCQFVF